MKKICASGLSAIGIDQSNARRRLILRRPDERRGDEREQQQPAEQQYDAGETAAGGLHGSAGAAGTIAKPARAVTDHVDVDVVERAHPFRRQDGFGRPGRQHPAVLQHHQRAAEPCRERQIVRRDDDGQCAIAVECFEQRADGQLVLEIERRGRLVEEQDRAGGARGARRDLRQRRRDDHPLFLAAAERRERPRLELGRPGGRQRFTGHAHVHRTFDGEGAEVRIASHQRHFENGVVEREVRLLGHDRHAPGDRRARQRGDWLPVEQDPPG